MNIIKIEGEGDKSPISPPPEYFTRMVQTWFKDRNKEPRPPILLRATPPSLHTSMALAMPGQSCLKVSWCSELYIPAAII